MPNLTGQHPYTKSDTHRTKRKKPTGLRKVSPKKAANKAAEKAAGAWEHMASVKALPCVVCGRHGVEVHHEGYPRSDFNVLPLCPPHHRREYGPQAYHYSKSNFYAKHGSSEYLLQRVADMLKEQS